MSLLNKSMFAFNKTHFHSKAISQMTKMSHIRINFKDFGEKLPLIKQNVINRNAQCYADPELVNNLYSQFRTKRHELDLLRKRRNEHAAALKQVVTLEDDDKKEKMLEQHNKIGKSFKTDVQKWEKELDQIESQLIAEALKLPNKTHPDSPIGGEKNNKLLWTGGPEVKTKTAKTKSHLEIGEKFDLLDFHNASKLTGSKFVFLKNEAALMELALVNWALSFVAKKGFTPMTTPDIAKVNVVEGCGFQPRDEAGQVYLLEGKHDCLIGTSEIPLGGMYSNEIIEKSSLPAKFVAYSHCFRKEAGKGEHSKGLYRLHQFSKVEMFGFTEGDKSKSDELFLEFVKIQEEIVKSLGLSYRVLDMASEELGAAAYRKYDFEAWLPSKKDFGEICSASNCTSYQSKRMNISYFDQGTERKLAHTVNATALAVPRIIMAILESFWNEEKQEVEMPDVLKPFLPFEKISHKRQGILINSEK